MKNDNSVDVRILTAEETHTSFDLEQIIFDLDSKIEMLTSKADALDYLISVSSGILCSVLDIIWQNEFSLENCKNTGDSQIKELVIKTSKMLGCNSDQVTDCVSFLEKKFPLPSDGNTPVFGGGSQHHLRDFSHHPSIVGLIFSLLTQFSGNAYGTNKYGEFIIEPILEKSKAYIGIDTQDKILKGTITWFFHLVSDIAGSSSTAGTNGGTGIPGPILSVAKELSVLPFFKDIKVDDHKMSVLLSKLFNGTLFIKRDSAGKLIRESEVRFDFRTELGVVNYVGKQAVPVIANECIVRSFYFIRRMAKEIKSNNISSIEDFSLIDWNLVKPNNSPTLTRMLTVSTGVFTTIDISESWIKPGNLFVSVNLVGVGRFAVAISSETENFLKIRDIKQIKKMYQDIETNTYTKLDDRIYERISDGMNLDKMAITIKQTEVLYNLEYYKVLNDINHTKSLVGNELFISLKKDWLEEWQSYMESGFSAFVQDDTAVLHWYSPEELFDVIRENNPDKPWLRLVLLEAMLFEPYFPLSTVLDKKGKEIPSKKYDSLHNLLAAYNRKEADLYLDSFLPVEFIEKGYVKILRTSYVRATHELNEVLKALLTGVTITAISTVAVVLTAGIAAPVIAVSLVGSQFVGLSGAALTSASLAYLGGGAVAIGGLGMIGGTAAIVGGGAVLGAGIGASIGGVVGVTTVAGKKVTIQQSAKLMVSMREIFMNVEGDVEFSNTVYEQFVQKIMEIEKGLVELKLKENVATDDEKKLLKNEIKNAEQSVEIMKIARKSMLKFNSSFEEGLKANKL